MSAPIRTMPRPASAAKPRQNVVGYGTARNPASRSMLNGGSSRRLTKSSEDVSGFGEILASLWGKIARLNMVTFEIQLPI